ncbi:P-loop containing nucleoside triphosphate hydrolase protein [Paraphysoderma sedebokerense]|nr:P-loop containing nucleoside triphosphate hydrolase protein [Paraphysoderma sedebokerense]
MLLNPHILYRVKLANEITYKRLTEALNALLAHFTKSPTSLTRVLFGLQDPSYESSIPKIDFYNPNLNDSQKDAVKFALSAREIALIHGPPGTGKTYTLVEVIQQLVKRGERVLVCGPSNISVDNLVERLSKSRIPLVRVGHPARILPQVLNHSLDILIRTSHEGQIVSDVIKEMDAILSSIQKSKNRFERKKMYGELKELKKELKSREIKVLNELVKGSKIVLSTLNGAANKVLLKEEFDTVVIDECTQSVEPEDWIALLKGKKAILAGDHLQLPPTVKSISTFPDVYAEINGLSNSKSSSELKAENLAVTLFDRLLKMYGNRIKRLLNVQYRMHQDIMEYCSNALYEGKLIAHESNASHLLCQLPYVESTPETTVPLILIDTAGMDYHESVSSSNTNSTATLLEESKYNEHEAEVVTSITEKLISAGLKPSDIAIITPYNAQVSLLISLIKESYPDIEIGSVDGFQGREKEAVIVSLVRSNDKGEIGFLKDSRRINVAVTRAKRLLVLVADSDTIGKSAFLKGLVEFMEERGEVRYPGYD